MPEGISRRIVFLPLITSVCPALCPPWKRTTQSAWSVSQSTTLPLPSSPHWVPITTTFFAMLYPRRVYPVPRMIVERREKTYSSKRFDPRLSTASYFTDLPLALPLHEFALAAPLVRFVLVPWKDLNHHDARGAQACHGGVHGAVANPRRADATWGWLSRREARQIQQIQRETGRRPRTTESLADAIIASAKSDGVGQPGAVRREDDATVIVIAA